MMLPRWVQSRAVIYGSGVPCFLEQIAEFIVFEDMIVPAEKNSLVRSVMHIVMAM